MGHIVLGAVIETICKKSISAVLQELVFEPLGIESARFHELISLDQLEVSVCCAKLSAIECGLKGL